MTAASGGNLLSNTFSVVFAVPGNAALIAGIASTTLGWRFSRTNYLAWPASRNS